MVKGGVEDELVAGHDHAWSFDKVIADVKQMKPHFPPGAKGRALYSDTNYQLLGRIIETATNQTLEEVFTQACSGVDRTFRFVGSFCLLFSEEGHLSVRHGQPNNPAQPALQVDAAGVEWIVIRKRVS